MATEKTLTRKIRRELAECVKTYPCAANTQEEAERLFVEIYESPEIENNEYLTKLDDKRAYVFMMVKGKLQSNHIDERNSWMREE